jgi:hypothetical protein
LLAVVVGRRCVSEGCPGLGPLETRETEKKELPSIAAGGVFAAAEPIAAAAGAPCGRADPVKGGVGTASAVLGNLTRLPWRDGARLGGDDARKQESEDYP